MYDVRKKQSRKKGAKELSPMQRHYAKRGSGGFKIKVSDEELKPVRPKVIIKKQEPMVKIEIDMQSEFFRGEMKKTRGFVSRYESEVDAAVKLYTAQGKNPVVVTKKPTEE